jgi:signal transduction histidine kinase
MDKSFSISYKWAIILAVMVLILLSLGLVINKLFFYDYYLMKEKQAIYSFAEAVDKNYDDVSKTTQLIDEFILRNQASVNLYSETESFNFSFSMFSSGHFSGRGNGNRKNINLPHGVELDLTNEGYVFFDFEHDAIRTQLLGMVYKLENDDVLLVTLPFEGLSNTADIAIRFNFYIVMILLGFALIIVILLSKRMTKPIIQLSTITKKISQLDFSESYTGQTNDEIHELGININSMSASLEHALDDLNEANDQLKLDLQEKEKNVKMRKALIANVSHELKTPIALVMSYAEGLRENEALNDDRKSYYVNVISKEADHMDALVRDLLDLTELEYDAYKLDLTTFDMSSLIDELIDRYAYLIKEKNIRIKLDKEDIVELKADKRRIEQAITNLLLNAIEHTPEEGEVVITVTEDNTLKLTIFNTGTHIPTQEIDRIWTSFFKSKKQKKRRIGGSGIGLSIVRAVIEKHGGLYGVRNDINGVSFWIEI